MFLLLERARQALAFVAIHLVRKPGTRNFEIVESQLVLDVPGWWIHTWAVDVMYVPCIPKSKLTWSFLILSLCAECQLVAEVCPTARDSSVLCFGCKQIQSSSPYALRFCCEIGRITFGNSYMGRNHWGPEKSTPVSKTMQDLHYSCWRSFSSKELWYSWRRGFQRPYLSLY